MVLLWCLETAPLNAEQRKALDRAQVGMFAQMAHVKRRWRDDECWITWAKRRNRCCRYLIEHYSSFVSDRLLAKYFSWCGHVGRFHSDRWATNCTAWMGCCWKERGRYDGNWAAYKPESRWKIRAVNSAPHLEWEKMIFNFFNENDKKWWEVAQNKDEWRKLSCEFVQRYSSTVHIPDEISGLSMNELQAIEHGQPWKEEDLQLWILA